MKKEIGQIVAEGKIVTEQGNFKDLRKQIQGDSDSIQNIIDSLNLKIESLRLTPIGEENQLRLEYISNDLDEINKEIKVNQLQYDKELKERQEFWRLHKLKENEIDILKKDINELKKVKINLGCDNQNDLDRYVRKKCEDLDLDISKIDKSKQALQAESNKYKSQWSPLHTNSENNLTKTKSIKIRS